MDTTQEIRLSNGIPVILHDFEGSVATTYWWVQSGGADEAPREAGFSHFLEHMLFKDAAAKETGVASSGKMAQSIEALGGEVNAYTSFDQTVYHVSCAAHHWEAVLREFGPIAAPQKFFRQDFEREREVILEELRKNEDSPERQLFQKLFSITYKRHPYGRPVIGFQKILKAAKVSDLDKFYRHRYVSGRMGLVLVGPMGPEGSVRRKGLIKQLEKYFGAGVIPQRHAPECPRVIETEVRPDVSIATQAFDVATSKVAFSFRVPGLRHPDVPALDVAAGILGMGEMSRLYQKLFCEMGEVTDISGGLYVPSDPGMLFFQAEVESPDRIPLVLETVFSEIQELAKKGPTPDELSRVIVNAESERLYSTQSVDGVASRLGFMRFVLGDLDFDRQYLEDIKRVDAEKVREVIASTLHYGRLNAVALVPKAQKGFSLAAQAKLAKQTLLPPQKAVSSKHKVTKIQEARSAEFWTLPSGIRVAAFERPQSHVLSVHAALPGGLRLEGSDSWGASHLIGMTWNKGTAQKSARDIASFVEGRASVIAGFSGRNSVGLELTGLARDWDALSRLFNEVLLEPSFPEEEVTHSKRVTEDTLRSLDDHSSQLCSKLFLETLFEHHPYGRLTYGSLESVSSMDSKVLRAFHKRVFDPKELVVAVSGPIKKARLETWFDELGSYATKAFSAGRVSEGMSTIHDESVLKASRWVEKNLSREQVHIILGGLGTKITAPDRFALRLLQTLLGGQGGRLFLELREKRSLAYTVSPISFEGVERGYVGVYMASAPQKKDEAVQGISEVLLKLAEKGPTASELKRAHEFYLGRRAMELQSDSALAAHFGLQVLYGVPHLSDEELIKKVRAVTAKDIQNVCRKYFVDSYLVTSVVG
ncbi:pitrilysin family protein [Bdellovibrionota bacterium FG-2]